MEDRWQLIPFCEYPEPLDLTGKNLFSLFNCSKEDLQTIIAPMQPKWEMKVEELPPEYLLTMTGEVADEIHEWPNAIFGSEFYHLKLNFQNNQLIGFTWKSRALQSSNKKPWWKLW